MTNLEIQLAFICPICGRIWPTAKLAQSCLDQGFEKVDVKPGDIVQVGGHRYGWYDGDSAWVDPETVKQRKMDLFALYYVVTAITYPPDRHSWTGDLLAWASNADDNYAGHRAQIHVETPAMSGKEGHRIGYTYTSGHYRCSKVDRPDLEASGKELIGNIAKHLI
jgi:hypothetical protein